VCSLLSAGRDPQCNGNRSIKAPAFVESYGYYNRQTLVSGKEFATGRSPNPPSFRWLGEHGGVP
jgi:hypothetical protein